MVRANIQRNAMGTVPVIYNTTHSLNSPLSAAVKENAAETCASKCKIGGSDDPLLQLEDSLTVKNQQEYDACYSKCVAQETKEVAEEREKVSCGSLTCSGTAAVAC